MQHFHNETRRADAAALAHDLCGRWHGHYGTAPCPVCQSERRRDQSALTLADGRDGRLLLHCKRCGCGFRHILEAAGLAPGCYTAPDPAALAQRARAAQAEAVKRARQAERCWNEALPIEGTPAARYLRGRGITCNLPGTLRFHAEAWHGPTAKRHAAMVARIEGADGFAVHRTFLRPDGSGKAGLDGGDKLMLGATAGGAVRLTDGPGPLVVAEGIETALSLASGLLARPATIWAALSTSGMRALRLPPSPGRLTIATDGDDPGRAAGRDLAERAHGLGWQVSLLPAPHGRDWNDILTMKGEIA